MLQNDWEQFRDALYERLVIISANIGALRRQDDKERLTTLRGVAAYLCEVDQYIMDLKPWYPVRFVMRYADQSEANNTMFVHPNAQSPDYFPVDVMNLLPNKMINHLGQMNEKRLIKVEFQKELEQLESKVKELIEAVATYAYNQTGRRSVWYDETQ